jgi:uncharacterized protein YndB with AHSA1/START domain
MTSTDGDTRIVGTVLRLADGKGAVRMEVLYETGIEDLWSALTEPARLARWVAEVDGDLRPGGQLHARFTSAWEGPGRIDTCQPPHRLAVTMAPDTDDETVIEATLATEDDGTRLVIEERGLPIDALAYHGAGWQVHVEDLSAHLHGESSGGWRSRWTALTPAYEELLRGLGPAT